MTYIRLYEQEIYEPKMEELRYFSRIQWTWELHWSTDITAEIARYTVYGK